MKKKCRGTPVVIDANGESRLERITLGGGEYSEAWLQKLMHDHPSVLPIHMIEPAFGDPIAIAREVPCATGYIDNLFLTPSGEIILVEAKLWRNAELRRKVVAQALDYVAALTAMDYPSFETMILKGCKIDAPSLHALIAHHPDAYDEPEFADAVSANLRRGRMLVLAVAEGIREETESLVGLLQSHAGAHFTFALVELGCWRNKDTGDILCVPDTLAQTVMIERGIVVIEGGIPKVLPVAPAKRDAKPHSLSEEMFYEELAQLNAGLPDAIKAFITRVEPLGIYAEVKNGLSFKMNAPDGSRPIILALIDRKGRVWTDYLANGVPSAIAAAYAQALSTTIGGRPHSKTGLTVTTNGTSPPLVSALLPEHAETWADAMVDVLHSVNEMAEAA